MTTYRVENDPQRRRFTTELEALDHAHGLLHETGQEQTVLMTFVSGNVTIPMCAVRPIREAGTVEA